MVICTVDMVAKRGWTKIRFFIFTLNMNQKLEKAEHEGTRKKVWHTCSLHNLDFLPVCSSP